MSCTSSLGNVPAIDRAFSVLELLAESRTGLSMSTVARQLAVPKSSMSLIFTTLVNRGYLCKDLASHKFFPGPNLKGLAKASFEVIELRKRFRTFLLDLSKMTGLTANMAVLEDNMAVVVDTVQSRRILTNGNWVGQQMRLHCTALGKALLAFVSEDEFNRVLQGRPLIQYNPSTISSIAKLKVEMNKVRAAGYALDNEEEEIGGRCVGAPILDDSGKVVSAVSVAGSALQLPLDHVELLSSYVKNTARRISWALGHGIRT